jgi:GNAT superfamily N-acetyltransferase
MEVPFRRGYDIKDPRRVLDYPVVGEHDVGFPLVIRKNALNRYATTGERVCGFADLSGDSYAHSGPDLSLEGLNNFLYAQLLKVEPEFFRHGIATILIESVIEGALPFGKPILILPERPDVEDMSKEERDYRFPISTEDLRAFYLRHGFREFTEEEVEKCAWRMDVYLNPGMRDPKRQAWVRKHLIQDV